MREELGSLTLHLTEEHRVTRGRGVMLVVGDLTLEEQEFMQFSLYEYFVTIGSYPDSNISCAFCGEKLQLEKELNGEVRTCKLKDHIKKDHRVLALENILTELNMLEQDKMLQVIDSFLLKNGLKTDRFKRYHAILNKENKQDTDNGDCKRLSDLESLLGNILENPAFQEGKRRYRIRKDKGVKKGKMAYALNRPKRVLECKLCPYTTQSKPDILRRHVRIHTKEKPYKCAICIEMFGTSSELVYHRKRKHTLDKKYCCNVCGRAFFENKELNRHLLTHENIRENTIKCDLCDYGTDIPENLRRHKKSHFPSNKSFECNQCKKVFGNKQHLQRHSKLHNIESSKIFKCELCERSFQENYNLRKHVSIVHNNDVRKFKCNYCEKSLRKKYDLYFHIEVAHPDTSAPCPEWKCLKCDKLYPHSRALKGHTKMFHNTQPKHPCPPCKLVFKTKTKLDRHRNTESHSKVQTKLKIKSCIQTEKQ